MGSSDAIVERPRSVSQRARHPALGDAALVLFAVTCVALTYLSSRDSATLAAAAVLAVSTAAAMHARLAMGRWRAAAQIVACAAFLIQMGATAAVVAALLVSGLVGGELIARSARQSAVLQAAMWTGIVAGLTSLSGLAFAEPRAAGAVLRRALAAAAGGFLSAPVMLTLGPMAEWLFGHTTRLTMSEWLSYQHPLLRDLSSKAPGTFQHSVNVGVLAEAAAGAVGGDALLAHLGGLYHDVGKMQAPEYFIENQRGTNPHDRLNPWESASILRAHVSDGVDMIREHRMGGRIADFVREHHGTGAMRLLREKAEAMDRTGREEDTYRYAGPRPRSRETALVMIADQLEATARSAPPPDDAACDEMVRLTIERIQRERQLDDSGCTERDFAGVRTAFARALRGMYHRRLEYPPSDNGSRRTPKLAFVSRVLARRRA